MGLEQRVSKRWQNFHTWMNHSFSFSYYIWKKKIQVYLLVFLLFLIFRSLVSRPVYIFSVYFLKYIISCLSSFSCVVVFCPTVCVLAVNFYRSGKDSMFLTYFWGIVVSPNNVAEECITQVIRTGLLLKSFCCARHNKRHSYNFCFIDLDLHRTSVFYFPMSPPVCYEEFWCDVFGAEPFKHDPFSVFPSSAWTIKY